MSYPSITYSDEAGDSFVTAIERIAEAELTVALTLDDGEQIDVVIAFIVPPADGMGYELVAHPWDDDTGTADELNPRRFPTEHVDDIEVY